MSSILNSIKIENHQNITKQKKKTPNDLGFPDLIITHIAGNSNIFPGLTPIPIIA